MKAITTTGIALLAALCMAAAPALGAEKKGSSESKSAPKVELRNKAKRETRIEPKAKKDAIQQRTPKAKRGVDRKALSKTGAARDTKDLAEKSGITRNLDDPTSPRKLGRKDPSQQGNVSDPSSGNPSGPASQAAEQRAGRGPAPAAGGSSRDGSPVDDARSALPKRASRGVDAGEPGAVANPAGDPLAKAAGVGAPAPTARELQDQSQAAKGDRTGQASTVFRVDIKKPFNEQAGGIVQKDGNITPMPDKNKKKDDDEGEGEQAEDDSDDDADSEQAEATAEWNADCENIDENGFCYDKGDSATRPVDGSVTEYVTPMTDEEIAARRAETQAGLVNPTEEGGRGELADPNRAREIGRSVSPRAGWAIDPGSGEAGGPAPSPGEAPERPDECDLAGGEGAGCGSGGGLSQ